jgi:prepilin-type N-terminal cleavage/methylation domain-containing protein
MAPHVQSHQHLIMRATEITKLEMTKNFSTSSRAAKSTVSRSRQSGFTVLELVATVTILLIVAGLAIPGVMQMVHSSRLRGVANDFSGLIQQDRIRSVQDDRSYSTNVNAAVGATPATAYIDLKQNSTIAVGDPEMLLPTEITMKAAAGAPNTANLKTQLLPALSPVVPQDAAPASGTPITFSPRGLPCTPVAYACSGAGLAPAAYWAFFQDTQSTDWEAVTVSPAGRIQKWIYARGVWSKMY